MTGRHGWLRTFVSHGVYQALLAVMVPVFGAIFVVKNTVRGTLDGELIAWALGRLGLGAAARPAATTSSPIWVHAVSVGEVRACAAFVEAVGRTRDVVVSTSTPTGLATARTLFGDRAFVMPLDLGACVGAAFRRLRPRALLLVELEVWPTLLRHANRRDVPVAVVSGRLTEGSARRYASLAWWLPAFERVDLVAAQDDTIARRFVDVGVASERVHVAGNLKHEGTRAAEPDQVAALGRELGLDAAEERTLVAGSTHEGEEEFVLSIWEHLRETLGPVRLVLVPRHPPRVPSVQRLVSDRRHPVTLRSSVSSAGDWAPGAVLLVDTLGELNALFGLADVVFLGGSLVPVGGHNVVEPAIAERAQVVGPHVATCRYEAEQLRDAEALWIARDTDDAAQLICQLLADEALRERAGKQAGRVVAGLCGATEKHLSLLAPMLERPR